MKANYKRLIMIRILDIMDNSYENAQISTSIKQIDILNAVYMLASAWRAVELRKIIDSFKHSISACVSETIKIVVLPSSRDFYARTP
jgi:hypothetical protein